MRTHTAISSGRQKAIKHMASILAQSPVIHGFLKLKPSIFGEAIKMKLETFRITVFKWSLFCGSDGAARVSIPKEWGSVTKRIEGYITNYANAHEGGRTFRCFRTTEWSLTIR